MKTNSPYSSDMQTKLFEAKKLLMYIPSDDRADWVSIGMALKYEYQDSALELFDIWSSSSNKYDPKAVRDVWKSFRGSGKTLGTLKWLARRHGWVPNTKMVGHQPSQSPKNRKQLIETASSDDHSAFAKRLYLAARFDESYVLGHGYALKKGLFTAAGVRRGNVTGKLLGRETDCLVIPIFSIESGQVQGVECVNRDGVKQSFGVKSGGAYILGNSLQKRDPWYVLEGYASAYSTVFHLGKHTAVCSFGKASQNNVALEIYKVFNPDEIVILRESDE